MEENNNTNLESNGTPEAEALIKQLRDENAKLKASVSNASAEASKYKKSLKELQTAEQNKAQEEAEEKERMKEELTTLRKEKTISEYTSQFLGIGYSEALAKEKAEALANGDIAKANAVEKTFLEETGKKATAEALKNMGKPPLNNAGGTLTKADILKEKDIVKRRKLIEDNIALFE